MSDAQSFYLLLVLFYLFECLGFSPKGTRAFSSRGIRNLRWSPRGVAFPVHGIKIETFIAPFIPWPGMLALPSPQAKSAPIIPLSLRHLSTRTRILASCTGPLRMTGLLIFLHFFILLPVCYYYYARTPVIPGALAYGYALCLLAAFRFHALHKRFFPSQSTERFKHTLFTAFLPWHAIRSADLIIKEQSARWNPYVLLATHPHAPSNKRALRRAWNQALYFPTPEISKEDLQSLFHQAKLNIDHYTAPRQVGPGEVSCPVCETTYADTITHCANCSGVTLH